MTVPRPQRTPATYVEWFWDEPEEALVALIVEIRSHHGSLASFTREVVALSSQRYPDWYLAPKTLGFWARYATRTTDQNARFPSFAPGVRLFKVLLELKTRHERDLVQATLALK